MAIARRHRGFEIGHVLGRTFPIWGRNFIPFMILSLVIYAPMLLFAILAVPETREGMLPYTMVLLVLSWLLGIVVTGALVFGVFCQLRGQPAGIGDCIRVGFARLLPVLAVGILVGLIAGAPLFVAGLLGALLGGGAALILFLLAIVPSIILFLRYWVAVPVAVVERPGVVASIKRSSALTQGNKASIFVILFVLGILQGIVNKLAEFMTSHDNVTVSILTTQLVAIALGALTAVATAVGYHDLRVAKEGVGIEELVKVFD